MSYKNTKIFFVPQGPLHSIFEIVVSHYFYLISVILSSIMKCKYKDGIEQNVDKN